MSRKIWVTITSTDGQHCIDLSNADRATLEGLKIELYEPGGDKQIYNFSTPADAAHAYQKIYKWLKSTETEL